MEEAKKDYIGEDQESALLYITQHNTICLRTFLVKIDILINRNLIKNESMKMLYHDK